MKVFITGGAGFVGSALAKQFRADGAEVTVLDNLKRRGSEINLAEFKTRGISFVHGDIRNPSDFEDLGNFDHLIEASAEPSVHAGLTGSPQYLLDTNLNGSIHCFNFARKHIGSSVFLSTSRVYSLKDLLALPLQEGASRLQPANPTNISGFSERGISEAFSTQTARSLYGATKLCSEILLQEYVHAFQLKAVINRCGVIAGAGQFGKVDQGVFTLWLANHHFQKPLRYTGFGGKGLQVRDLLHPADLYQLLREQLQGKLAGEIYNVGGGQACSTSLLEWTKLAQEFTGKSLTIESSKDTASVDVPYYVSDCQKAQQSFTWLPKHNSTSIAKEIAQWIQKDEALLRPLFG